MLHRGEPETIWALRDVSFELGRGQVLGIVGRNGAGKSTLLKILSRITEPTAGRAEISGRLASLLEVGTGFHPELTGRDNVFLNGAILGMRRTEIAAKFSEIVEFAGVEKFIDTPVKRYSSGMYMRLGFAVAAHLDPDILVVDEILSVGDADFQRRSLGKMREVTGEGRTVLFVSHNMTAIRSLCDRAMMLEEGHIVAEGAVDTVVTRYLDTMQSSHATGAAEIATFRARKGTREAVFRQIRLVDGRGTVSSRLESDQPFTVELEFDAKVPIHDAVFEVGVSTLDGLRVTTSFCTDGGAKALAVEIGEASIAVELKLGLMPGTYAIDLAVHHAINGWAIDMVDRVIEFEIVDRTGRGDDRLLHTKGFVRPVARWQNGEEQVAVGS
jgi:lipopolysaccharide transport system ATP-binding protein